MKVFDQFFTKFAYKFDKGYPDMNNDQDVLLLETLLSEVLGEYYLFRRIKKSNITYKSNITNGHGDLTPAGKKTLIDKKITTDLVR